MRRNCFFDFSLWNRIDGTIYEDVRSAMALHLEPAHEGVYANDPTRPSAVQLQLKWNVQA